MSEQPLVSIVTPAYNQAAFLADTLDSVKQQTYVRLEHLVLDDGSTDETREVLKRYEGTYAMQWRSKSNSGQSDTINQGFRQTRGDIVAWLNSDDVYYSRTAVADAVAAFDRHPAAAIMLGDLALITDDNRVFRLMPALRYLSRRRLFCSCPSQPSMFMRRWVVEQYPLLTRLRYRMDYEYWLRIATEHPQRSLWAYVPKVLGAFRVHAQSNTVAAASGTYEELRQIHAQYFGRGSGWCEPAGRRLVGVYQRLRGLATLNRLYEAELAFPGRLPSKEKLWWWQLGLAMGAFAGGNSLTPRVYLDTLNF